jgi:type IV secretion system protein VirB5
MKKTLFSTFIAMSFFVSNVSNAGIPVFDGAANANTLQQWAEKLQQWQETVRHYEAQINVANDQLKTLKGIKGHIKNFNVDDLIKDINAIDKLMPTYDSIVNGSWNKDAEKLSKKLGIDETCKKGVNKKLKNICKSENMNLASNYIAMEKVNQQVNAITKKIKGLARNVASSQDIKTTTDINNQIAVYNGQLEMLDRKLSITQKQYELNRNLIAKQREIAIKEKNLRPTNGMFEKFHKELTERQKSIRKSDGYLGD